MMMMSLVNYLSNRFDLPPDGLTLVLAILAGYPILRFYSAYIAASQPYRTRLFYLLGTGFSLVAWAYGFHVLHSLINCLVCYSTLQLLAPRIALTINTIFTMTYLLYGYILNQIDWNYSITWTMPQCILTLRLIAISFDIMDGSIQHQDPKQRHLSCMIKERPNIWEFLSFCYFPGTFFVGPLISYVTYEKLVKLGRYPYDEYRIQRISLYRLLAGLSFIFVYCIGIRIWPAEYLLSPAFKQLGLLGKLTTFAVTAKVHMYKYIMCWFLAEAGCLAAGLPDVDDQNCHCYNISWMTYETAPTFTTIISSYNITTNQFAFRYLYRRLKFLGNVHLSHLATLMFLALWHGIESGYYVVFFTEFLLVYFEKTGLPRLDRAIQHWWLTNGRCPAGLVWAVGKLYTFYFMGYSFMPFLYLHFRLWWPMLASTYFIGHAFLMAYALIAALVF